MEENYKLPCPTARKVHGIILSIAFCAFIAVPCVGTLFGWDMHPPRNENRRLAEMPVFADTALSEFPEKYEEYFKDHFGMRNTFIRRYRKLHYKVVGTRPEQVLVGQGKWLFFTHRGIMNDFRGESLLSDDELVQWKRVLESKRDWLNKRGIEYLFVIAPNKVQVYPDKLPTDIQKMAGKSRVEQLFDYLGANSELRLIYPKDALLEAKKERMVYFNHDTHWNDHGSLVAQREIVRSLQFRYPKLRAVTIDECKAKEVRYNGDLAKLIGSVKKYKGTRTQLTPKVVTSVSVPPPLRESALNGLPTVKSFENAKGHGRVLVFHDSFGKYGMRTTLPEVFAHTTFIHDYPNGPSFKQYVEDVKPEVVIEMYVERQLGFRAVRDKMLEWFKPLEE